MRWVRAFFRPLARVEADFLADIAGLVALGSLTISVLTLGGM